jgi:hypothetical protein
MPKRISETPHRMDNVEARRTIPDGVCCAIKTSSKGTSREFYARSLS